MLVPIALWSANVSGAFNNQKSIRAFGEVIAMKNTSGDHDVIAGSKRHLAHHTIENALALGDVPHLITLRSAGEKRIFYTRSSHGQRHIIVKQYRLAISGHASYPGELMRSKM